MNFCLGEPIRLLHAYRQRYNQNKKGRISTLAQYRYSMWQDIYMYIVCQRF